MSKFFRKIPSAIVTIIFLVSNVGFAQAQVSCAVPPSVPTWNYTSSPVGGVFTSAVNGSYIYTGGLASTSPTSSVGRIEKRNTSDGSLVWSVQDVSTNAVRSLVTDGTGLYVGATMATGFPNNLQKRNFADGSVIWSVAVTGTIFSVVVNANAVYVGSYVGNYAPNPELLHIEKRSLTDGSLIQSWTETGPSYIQTLAQLSIDSSGLYVVGSKYTGQYVWRVEKHDLNALATTWSKIGDHNGEAVTTITDASGVYVGGDVVTPISGVNVGQWYVEKLNGSDGSAIWSQMSYLTPNNGPATLALDGTAIYSAGAANTGLQSPSATDDWQWRVEKRNLTDGSAIWSWQYNPTTYADSVESINVSNGNLYLAGVGGIDGSGASPSQESWLGASIPSCGSGSGFIDIGLKIKEALGISSIAIENPLSATSPLHIAKNGTIYNIALVPSGDPNATAMKVQTKSGLLALRRYTGGGSGGQSLFYFAFTPFPSSVAPGGTGTMYWQAVGSASCATAGGPWGTGAVLPTMGSLSSGVVVQGNNTFTMKCTDASGSTSTYTTAVYIPAVVSNPIEHCYRYCN